MASIMDTISHSMQEQISELLKPHKVCLMKTVGLNHSTQHRGRPHCRVLVLTLWRGFMVTSREPARVESSFSYLEICSINIHSISQVVLETDRQTFSFSVTCVQDLEAMVSHMTTSLKKIFPDSSPGRLLKKIPPDLQERLWKMTSQVEEQLEGQPISCGGFSDTYAALCDFNELPCREEIQWDVDNIYHVHQCREFNLLDFNHLDNKDLAVAVAAVSFNQWFTKISCRDIKLSAEVQQQLVFLLSRSPSLEELSLEASGIKPDFALKMAASLREHTSSSLHSLNLSANHIEDKGVIALSQELGNLPVGLKHLSLSKVSMSSKGLGSLCQVFSTSQLISSTLMHLDLSGNPGSLATEEATFLFRFLSNANCLSHLDLSGTDCPLDTLFVSLSVGCCSKLSHLNLAKNPFSHRKLRAVTRSIQEFFSQCSELKYICLSATKLPSQALRLLLQGLATNTHLRGLELDLSSCELRSAGAQVIQEHIFETNAISSLDISDNGFESDMVTLVLSIGRCHSLRHLALGRNFAMKSRALTDVLQRIAQLIQEEECPLESLSVCDSKLKTGTTTLINLLGSNATLAKVDISGNAIGDTGAKMLAKALLTNTKLRTLVWDRNHVTARGYQDVADALERNFTLQQMSLPLSDATQSYRNNPERTEEALQKIQRCLHRNSQRLTGEEFQQGLGAQHAEKMVQGLCLRLENSLQPLTPSNLQEVQADLLSAEEVLHNTRKFLRLLPSLYELGRKPSGGDVLHCILTDTSTTLSNEITGDIQELAQALLTCIEGVCPRVVQRANVCERLAECVSKKIRQLNTFLTETLVEQTGHILSNKLCEIRQSLSVSLSESIIEQILQDLAVEQGKLDEHIRDDLSSAPKNNIPHLRLVDHDFPTDEYVPVIWRHTFHSKSMRPAPSVKSLLDVDWEQQSSERGERESTAAHLQQHHHHHQTHREQPHARGGEGGEVSGGEEEEEGGRERGRCASADGRGLARASTVTLLSAAASGGQLRSESPSPSPPPPPPPSSSSSSSASPRPSPCSQRRRGRGDEREVEAAEDAAEAVAAAVAGARGASVIPPLPPPPPDRPLPREEEAAGRGSSPAREAPVPLGGPGSPAGSMELLPTQGQTLRHYTASRPRPRRTRTQPPSTRPQEPVSETENEAMGRVDEGVEEFFTKKILPDYTLKGQWEESIPAQGTPPESSSNPSVPIPVSSSSSDNITTSIITSPTAPPSNTSSTPTAVVTSPSSSVSPLTSSSPPPTTTTTTTAPPSKNIKKKFGDFFAFKRARAGRAAKAGGGEAGGGEGVKVKRTSIADLIRPLREAKEREREREREKEREKERGSRLVEDVNLSNDAAVTEGTVATDGCLQGDKRDKMAPATTVTTTTPPSEATPPSPTTATPGLTTATSNLEEKGVTSLPVHPGHTPVSAASPPAAAPSKEQEKSWTLEKERKKGGGTPDGERRLKVTRRSLREGKSQSLILLTGLEPEEKDSSHSKKYASESTSSFEQRLQVMLHRIGVAKTSPADTKSSQNKDEELRKANSEGAILDKPEPPPTFLKPRTMSSSADTRRPMRAVEPLRSDPPLYPKPVIPERPVGPLPPKPVIAAKPCLPTPAAPGGGVGGGPPALQTTATPPQHAFHASLHLSSSAPRTTSPGLVQPWLPTLDRRPGEMEDSKTQTLNGSHEEHVAQVAVQRDSPGPTSAPSPRRDTPPAPSPRRGPSAQGRSERAQSVTDESLPKPRPRMKPLPQRRAVSVHEDALTMTQELKAVLERSPLRHRGNRGDLPTCTEDTPTGEDTGDTAGEAQRKSSKKEEEEERENREKNKMEKRRTGHGVTAVYEAAPAAVETPSLEAAEPEPASAIPPPALSLRPASALGSEKVQSPQERSPAPSTTVTLSHTVDKSHMTPSQEKTPSTTPATADVGESTQEERGETVSKQHTEKAEPPDQRTETLLFK